jgi:hypothetical protein
MTRTLLTAPAVVVAVVVLCASSIPAAHASADDTAVNGIFTVTSDGQFAKTNERFHDQATVVSTWTISSSCSTYQDCTGSVTSDHGWSAEVVYGGGRWRLVRTIDNWVRCPDGTAAPGEQSFLFWPVRTDAPNRHDFFTGWDETVGPSGACGVNRWVTVRMPLTLSRAG